MFLPFFIKIPNGFYNHVGLWLDGECRTNLVLANVKGAQEPWAVRGHSPCAKRFDVALSFIVKLLKQYRTTGEIAPKPFNGGVKLKLGSDKLVVLAELIEQNNDATLDELCQMLYEKLGINISRATMGRMTQRLQLTVKKNSVPE